jgi:hypothetical protein
MRFDQSDPVCWSISGVNPHEKLLIDKGFDPKMVAEVLRKLEETGEPLLLCRTTFVMPIKILIDF